MPAATGGYRSIGSDSPAPAPSSGSDLFTSPSSTTSTTTKEKFENVAKNAGAAAVGAKEAVSQLISAPGYDMNLYTEPLNPHAQLELRERVARFWDSCRPWKEFVDWKAFGVPPAAEVKRRIGHNIEMFLYNYLIVGLFVLLMFALFHPLQAGLMAGLVLLAIMMYIVYPDDYKITDTLFVTKPVKHVVVGSLGVMILTIGGVLELMFWVFMSVWPIVLLHAIAREHGVSGETETAGGQV